MKNGSSTSSVPLSSERYVHGAVAALAWSALLLQLILVLQATWHGRGPLHALVRLMSFFTIDSNLLVALTSSAAAFRPVGGIGNFLIDARVRGAIALYIAITAGIYLVVLSGHWSPRGLQWLADVLLHYVVPATYLAAWTAFTPGESLRWSDALRWLAFPLCYLIWTLARGSWAHEYPYPFVDVDALGLPVVLRNVAAIGVVLVLVAAMLIGFNRFIARCTSTS